jgi:site-specific DNA-methyltransferase (adenine-specific)
MIERNSLLNGDCLEVMKMIEDNSVDLVCTDPPYKITSRGNCGNSGGMMAKDISMKGKVFDNNDCNVKDWMPEIFRVLKNGSHCYIMCNQINLIEYLNVATQCGFHFIKSLIWDKQTKIMGRAYMSQFEYILFFRKGDFKQVNDCGISDIISIKNKKPKDKYGKNLHDTPKPISLMELLIKQSTSLGDLVLEPFMGIGSTCIAAKNINRNYIGIELDEKYYDIAVKRINNYKVEQSLFAGAENP